jgi:hypothetical protein
LERKVGIRDTARDNSHLEFVRYYGPGEDFLIFDWWAPREVRGHKELLDYYAPQFNGVRDMDIKIRVVKVASDGTFGAQVSQQHLPIDQYEGWNAAAYFISADRLRSPRWDDLVFVF